MSYQDKYQYYLEKIPELAAYSRKENKAPVFAYTSNLDVVLTWDIEKYNEILDTYLKEEPYFYDGDTIDSMEDFARISSYYLMRGLGGNFDLTSIEVCNFLKDKFQYDFFLGGTCAQGAAAIGTLGFPVNVHLSDECAEVMNILDEVGVTVIRDGRKVPAGSAPSGEEPVYHFILQFKKDDKLRIMGREVAIPLSNRLILFYDEIHKIVPIQKDFLQYWKDASEVPTSWLISGFDAVVEEDKMQNCLDALEPHLKYMKENHPEMTLYFEGAFYMNPKVKEMAGSAFCKYVDILGMNEEELEQQVKRFGGEAPGSAATGVLGGLDMILSRFHPKGIVLHTKDYSMYYGQPIPGVDIEQGLTMGNIMSTTRARIGKYGNFEECRETLPLPLSANGLRFAEEAEEWKSEGRIVVVVPTRYLEYPNFTIGLGDTFVSGVHTCFIRKE
ncbi:ADP-dependent glucokinase/phosphofructokinase [Lachnospiraceae bacterium JLR.KK008]